MPKTFSFPQFVAAAPENIRRVEQLGFAMKLFLSSNEDYSDPLILRLNKLV